MLSQQKTNRFLKALFSSTPDKCRLYLYYACQGWECQQEKAPTNAGAFVMVIAWCLLESFCNRNTVGEIPNFSIVAILLRVRRFVIFGQNIVFMHFAILVHDDNLRAFLSCV